MNASSPRSVRPAVTESNFVERAFAAQFPGWERMSPFDPVKLVAEGLAGSLAAVEARQKRVLESVLDAMPSLFGFAPKAAKLPLGLFRVEAPERLNRAASLEGRRLRLKTPGELLVLAPAAGTQILPVTTRSYERKATGLALTLSARGPLAELVLAFVPTAAAAPKRLLDVAIDVAGNVLTGKDLLIDDGTSGLSGFGQLRFRRRDGRPLSSDAGTLTVTLDTDGALLGELRTDVVAMAYGRRVEDVSLGHLTGEPWEACALPATLVGVPETVTLRFPDGRRRSLERLPDESLRTVVTAPAQFREGYLYDGVHHRLLIPGADELVGEWNGGVEVVLPEAMLLPSPSALEGAVESQLGDASAVLEALVPLQVLEPALPRETSVEFLERFFQTLRRLPGRAEFGTDVRPNEWASAVTGSVAAVRQTELKLEGARVVAHVLATDPHSPEAFRLNPSLVAEVQRRLDAELPLRFAAEVRPFVRTPVSVHVALTVGLSDAELAEFDESGAVRTVGAAVDELLLPAPFGDAEVQSERTIAQLQAMLERKLHRQWPTTAIAVRLRLTDAAGEIVERFLRLPGQCPEPAVTVALDRQVRPVAMTPGGAR